MRTGAGRVLAAIAGAWLVLSTGAAAADLPADLELALAIDVSGSIDAGEARLQREGYIAAFRNPRVIQAIKSGPIGRIAVAYYEWAGLGHMRVILPWTAIDSEASAHQVAEALTRNPPRTARRTAIAAAIDFGAAFFDNNGYDGRRRVIDISGDGPNNWGDLVTEARDRAIRGGVTINGLPILEDQPSAGMLPAIPGLDLYYQSCVIGGPGAFLVVAKDFQSFAEAVLRKLILEIADIRLERPPAADPRAARLLRGLPDLPTRGPGRNGGLHRAADPAAVPPCDAGERQWNRTWGN